MPPINKGWGLLGPGDPGFSGSSTCGSAAGPSTGRSPRSPFFGGSPPPPPPKEAANDSSPIPTIDLSSSSWSTSNVPDESFALLSTEEAPVTPLQSYHFWQGCNRRSGRQPSPLENFRKLLRKKRFHPTFYRGVTVLQYMEQVRPARLELSCFFKDWKALTFMLRPKLFVKSNGSTMLHARTETFRG